jgi:hypothetical protein
MCTLAGPDATVYFTSLSTCSATALATDLSTHEGENSLGRPRASFYTSRVGIKDLMVEHGVPIKKVCLLDPKAEKELSPEDGDGMFDWFLFGVSGPISSRRSAQV